MWSVLLLDRRDERRFLFFCYTRCTLVGRSETNVVSREVLTKRRNVLDSTRDTKVKRLSVMQRSQAECLWIQVYARLCRTRMGNTVQAAYYLYYETRKHRTS